MLSSLLINTKSNNNYLFNYYKQKVLFISPILNFIIKNHHNFIENINFYKDSKIFIEGIGEIDNNEIEYYYSKYIFLKENGFFENGELIVRKTNAEEISNAINQSESLVFETTEKCNLKCQYCIYGEFYGHYQTRRDKNMNFDIVKSLLNFRADNIKEEFSQEIEINFYGGEPLINKKLIEETIGLIKQKFATKIRPKYRMTTNGMLLKKHINTLTENDFSIMVSLDGDKESNSYRIKENGENSFDTVFLNLKYIKDYFPDFFSHNVKLGTVLHNRNDYNEVYEYFKKEFRKEKIEIILSNISTTGVSPEIRPKFNKVFLNNQFVSPANEDYTNMDTDLLIESFDKAAVAKLLHIVNEANLDTIFKSFFFSSNTNRLIIGGSTCLPGELSIFSLVDGTLLPCEHIGHEYAFGNVTETGVNIDYFKIAQKYNAYYKKIEHLCSRCYNILTCVQCMFYLDLGSDKPICNGFMNKEKYSKYLSTQIGHLEKNKDIYVDVLKKIIKITAMKIYLLMFLFFASYAFSQENIKISGKLTDSNTQEILSFASVQLENSGIGTCTNEKGVFELSIKKDKTEQITLLFSILGYESKKYTIENNSPEKFLNISLTAKTYMLSEVEIKPIDPLSIIKNAIKKIPENYNKGETKMDAYYKEIIKENNRFIKYTDAACTFNYYGYQKRFSSKKKTIYLIDDYTNVQLPDYFGKPVALVPKWDFPPFGKDQVKINAIRSSESFHTTHMYPIISGGILPITAADKVKLRADDMFLNEKNFINYNYTFTGYTEYNENKVYIIEFQPKIISNSTYSKNYFEGTIYIDANSLAFVGFEYHLINKHPKLKINLSFGSPEAFYSKPFPNTIDTLNLEGYGVKLNYRKIGEKWYLNTIRRKMDYELEFSKYYIFKESTPNVNFTTYETLLINEIHFGKTEKFKGEMKDSLIPFNINSSLGAFNQDYNKEFWEKYNKIVSTEIDDSIKSDLEYKDPIESQFVNRFATSGSVSQPLAEKISFTKTFHKDTIIDNYQWIHDIKNPKVMELLKNEYAYSQNLLRSQTKLQKAIFKEIANRDNLNETLENEYTTDETPNNIYLLKSSDNKFPVLLKKNKISGYQKPIFDFNKLPLSQDFTIDEVTINQSEKFVRVTASQSESLVSLNYIVDIDKCKIIDTLYDVESFIWSKNDSTYFYCESINNNYSVYENNIKGKSKKIFTENEKAAIYDIEKSESGEYIFVYYSTGFENETYFRKADLSDKGFQIVVKLKNGIRYSVKQNKSDFYIRTNENAINLKILKMNTESLNTTEFINHNENAFIRQFEIFKNYIVLNERRDGQDQLKVISLADTSKFYYIEFSEKFGLILIEPYQNINSDSLKIRFSSFKTPTANYVFELNQRKLKIEKQDKIENYKPENYVVEELLASNCGISIPITLFYKKGALRKNNNSKIVLSAYGAYGMDEYTGFTPNVLSLVDRGIVYAVAHVRGGKKFGPKWHNEGKLMNKKNTFSDFIACAEYLIENEYTKPQFLCAEGSSAGGLLIGVVINERPDLFNSVVLVVPSVDILTNMLDTTEYSETGNWREFGNPYDEQSYQYIKSYSPYENIKNQAYPNTLIIYGVQDQKIPYWVPATYTVKLREYNTGPNAIISRPIFEAHHNLGGQKITNDWNQAYIYTFILNNLFKQEQRSNNKR
ncbi:MAG: radical SAM peptide maturase [Bacteroidales bacterium]|nr:radical SAM peptide maturase [Bacteroidales bacterium]MBN2758334.1 radical SAM peptide maturase [Bacteroidales bacterium]